MHDLQLSCTVTGLPFVVTPTGKSVYGDFFPYQLSPYAFNDSDAQLFFPLAREEALRRGLRWIDEDARTQGLTAPVSGLPDRSAEADEATCQKSYACEDSGKAFRITAQELKRYKDRRLPLPRKHWLTRILRREALKNPVALYHDVSAKSGLPLLTTFPPGSGWQVWDVAEFSGIFA